MDGPLADYRDKGTTIASLPDATIGGRPAFSLLATLRDGFREAYYLDKVTYLIVAERHTAPIHAFGAPVTSETRFSDYRAVNGVVFPFRSSEVEISTNRELNAMQWSSIEVDRDLPQSAFSPPVLPRTDLQDFLEHLYYERSDSSAIRWSYDVFRRAHPEIDTRGGVEFIGYQMLKMGDHVGALALLRLNAADHPDASSSAFGLGRAYQAAGACAEARSEYRRALRLDPHNKRAADALASLRRQRRSNSEKCNGLSSSARVVGSARRKPGSPAVF